MTLDDYLDAAKKAIGTTSDNELGRRLKISGATINRYRNGGVYPTRDHMTDIARLAGLNEQVALCDWLSWDSTGPARKAAIAMRKTLSAACVLACVAFAFSIASAPPAHAETEARNYTLCDKCTPSYTSRTTAIRLWCSGVTRRAQRPC